MQTSSGNFIKDQVKQKSQFTHRHLQLLGRSSSLSPLRVIALVDYDAFYAQCETVRLNLPETQPLAVQQWNDIIALNYAGRGFGFKRGASVEDVKRLCPNIVLQHVATWREGESTWAYRADATDRMNMKTDKAALDPYRIQSRKSLEVIKKTLPQAPMQIVEKASIDEVFLDLSAQVHDILLSRYPELSLEVDDLEKNLPYPPENLILDWDTDHVVSTGEDGDDDGIRDWDDIALQVGAEVVRNLRKVIRERMKYTCSAGIAHNKAMAKLAAGHRKPNQQTVVQTRAIPHFLSTYKITSIRGLAGKLGTKAVEAFGVNSIPEFLEIPLDRMKSTLGVQDGTWLFDIIRGIENSDVTPRTDLQSMLTQKTFVPPLEDAERASSWLRIFSADLVGRINDLDVETGRLRRPTVLALHHHIRGRFGPTRSKQMTIPSGAQFTEELLFSMSWNLLKQISANNQTTWPCLSIGMSIHSFRPLIAQNQRITSFLIAKSTPDHRKRKRDDSPPHDDHALDTVCGRPGFIKKLREDASYHHQHDNPEFEPGSYKDVARASESVENALAAEYTCPNCSEKIRASLVLEHLDWHVALELQNQPF